jgi:selenocysteine lyase/cysteine desulfurase
LFNSIYFKTFVLCKLGFLTSKKNMNPHRRKFIKNIMGASIALGALGTLEAAALHSLSENPTEAEWEKVRGQFVLSKEKIYLNNGTMGVSPLTVLESTYKRMLYADEHGQYGGGENEAREALARFLGAKKEEIALTHNVTDGTNIVLMGFPFKKNDQIICTSHEHAGTAIPLMQRAQQDKLKLVAVDIYKDPTQTTAAILNAITPKTKLICIPHMPCTTGQLLDVETICKEARKLGIATLIDGAHPPGMLAVNLDTIDCDFYVGCGHKWMLGPKGTGFLFCKQSQITKIKPIFVGAGTYGAYRLNNTVQSMEKLAPDAQRFFYGSQNAALYIGMVQAIDFLSKEIGMQKVENRVKNLSAYVRKSMEDSVPNIDFYCPDNEKYRTGVCAFKVPNLNAENICNTLRKKNIIVRHVHENKLDLIRVSTHIYNTKEDVDRFVETFRALL